MAKRQKLQEAARTSRPLRSLDFSHSPGVSFTWFGIKSYNKKQLHLKNSVDLIKFVFGVKNTLRQHHPRWLRVYFTGEYELNQNVRYACDEPCFMV